MEDSNHSNTIDPLSLEIPQDMIMDISNSAKNWNNTDSNFDGFKTDDSNPTQPSINPSRNKSFQYDQRQYNISPLQSNHLDHPSRENQRQENNNEEFNERS